MENADNFSDISPVAALYSRWKTPGSVGEDNTAYVALLLAGLCVGQPWLVGAIIRLFRSKASRDALTVLNVSLVFVALLQCLSSPMLVHLLLMDYPRCDFEHCDRFLMAWHFSRHCGVLLHLLAALEFVFADTACGRKLFHYSLPVPVVLTLVVVCMLFANVDWASNAGLGALACVFAVPACWAAAAACARCQGPGAGSAPASTRKAIALALVAFGIYFPSFVMACMIEHNWIPDSYEYFNHTYRVVVYLNNLRLVTDACLFWLITGEPNGPPQRPQQQYEDHMLSSATNTDGVPAAGPSLPGGIHGSVPTAGGGGGGVGQQGAAAGGPPNGFVLQSDKL